VSTSGPVELTVYPDDCDAFGHLNHATMFRLFERARWEVLEHGPGMDAFRSQGTWPAVRKVEAEFFQQVAPGDRLRFELEVERWGETSFTVRQTARRVGGEGVAAAAQVVLVAIGGDGRPALLPTAVGRFLGVRPSRHTDASQQFSVRELAITADVSGDGPPVLFVHGFPLDRTLWRPVARTLTGWRRIAPDLRGFGMSEAPETGYTMAEYADDLAALLDVVGAEQVVVCGLSMGGYIAFELYRRHPDRVRALVLANTRAGGDSADGRAGRDAMIARIRRDGPAFLADAMLPRLLAPASLQTEPEVVRRVRAMVSAQRADGLVGALTAMRDRADSSALLPTISVPTLVIAGSDDQLIPAAEARVMAEAIPNAHFATIPGAGHLAPIEQAVNTARVIREFLEALL
jgi:3-oxoadipate enol-lactonase